MQNIILQHHPNAIISVSIVWIKMLPSDNATTAKKAAQSIGDTRVRHFYDSKRRVGEIIARGFGESPKIGWDIYLLYSAGSRWGTMPPQPVAWVHQLSDSWLEHYRHGDNLEKELRKIAEQLKF